jgi:hypothetical protein
MSAPETLSDALADGWGDDNWKFEDVVEGDGHGAVAPVVAVKCAESAWDGSVTPGHDANCGCSICERRRALRPLASGVHVSRASAGETASPLTETQ